jgi:hypothetical protein
MGLGELAQKGSRKRGALLRFALAIFSEAGACVQSQTCPIKDVMPNARDSPVEKTTADFVMIAFFFLLQSFD